MYVFFQHYLETSEYKIEKIEKQMHQNSTKTKQSSELTLSNGTYSVPCLR